MSRSIRKASMLCNLSYTSCATDYVGMNYIHGSQWSCQFHCAMMTSSNGNIFRVTGPLCGEFTGPGDFPTQRPVTRSFDVFFDLRLNKRLSKQPWGWWFETPSWSLWRHCNGPRVLQLMSFRINQFPFNSSLQKNSSCIQDNTRHCGSLSCRLMQCVWQFHGYHL